jgi:membrane protein DedA with SNARE-associated domain
VELPALAFLAAVLAVKEAGVPIPVPGDLLVIGAGAAAGRGGLPAAAIVVVLIAATVLGGAIQFALIRGRARTVVLRLLGRVGLGQASIERGAGRLRNGGATAVAVARMTPGVRIVAVASSAIADVGLRSFLLGLLVGNGVFLTGHFVLGLVLGQPAVQLVSSAGTGLLVLGLGFAALGIAGWWLIVRRRGTARAGAAAATNPATRAALDWSDACCPACLALALVAPARGEPA